MSLKISCIVNWELTVSGLEHGGENVRSSWADDAMMELILGAMMPANRLALEVSDATGLRIDDVLSLKTETVERTSRPYVTDSKTGKRHRIYLPVQLRERMLRQAGSIYVFPGRLEPTKHRTRQTVYKDMMHAVRVFRRCGALDDDRHISPHTMRKRAAVRTYRRAGLEAAAAMLQHSPNDAAVTMLYALADVEQPRPKRGRKRGKA